MSFDSWGEFYDGSSLPARVWPQQQGAELNHHACCARFVAIRCAWTTQPASHHLQQPSKSIARLVRVSAARSGPLADDG